MKTETSLVLEKKYLVHHSAHSRVSMPKNGLDVLFSSKLKKKIEIPTMTLVSPPKNVVAFGYQHLILSDC